MRPDNTKEYAARRISRREFLGIGAAAAGTAALAGSGFGVLVPRGGHPQVAHAVTTAVRLRPFVNALPIPPVLPAGANLSLTLDQTAHRFHKDLPAVQVWGYNDGVKKTGGYLGPTIVATKGTPTQVSYTNRLPAKHLLKVDPTITQMKGKPLNTRILTHLHGGHISDVADGNPFASTDLQRGQTQTVRYANDQEAAHIWYHDHALGITRLNVMAGLAGNYLVRDDVDDGQGGNFPDGNKLPSGDYEIPLAIQDRAFTKGGELKYPAQWTPEFFGDVVVVNGKVWPFKKVEPRKYRMRILNGSNSRFYNLQLTGGATMTQLGTDGGFLAAPVPLESLLIAPGERADVIFDFTSLSGNVDLLDTELPEPTENPADPLEPPEVMRFKVVLPLNAAIPDGPLPVQLRGEAFSVPGTVARERYLTLEEVLAGPVPTALLLNGLHFADPVTERPALGKTEVWTLINLSADTHPIHLHLVQFEVLERRQLDVAGYQAALDEARARVGGPVDTNGELVNPDPSPYLGVAEELVDDNEKGPKDTVRANPAQITRIKAKFDLPAGAPTPTTDKPAKYVWHCHILEHEDNDMMRPYTVV